MRCDNVDKDEENHVLVKNDNKSVLIRVSPETTVSQVLCQACEKWNLPYNQHVLKYHAEETLDNDHLMYDCVPPNSTVHITAALDTSNYPDQVTVSFGGDAPRVTKSFDNTERLSQVMKVLMSSEETARLTSQSKEARPSSRSKRSDKLNDKSTKKLLVSLNEGTVCLDDKHLDKVSLSDFKHNGHISLSLQHNDLDDYDDSTNNDESVTTGKKKWQQEREESEIFNINQDSKRQLSNEEDSDPSVTKIKKLIIVPHYCKTQHQDVQPICNQAPLDQQYLFERRGLVYRVEDAASSTEVSNMKLSEASLGVYSESWISVRFPDGLAIQASFSPLEYVYDVISYLRKFLVLPDAEFELSLDGQTLDAKRSLFTSRLVPSAKVDFIQLHQNQESNSTKCTTNNVLDPKYLTKVVSQSVAAATAVHFRQICPEILVESEFYKPEEVNWDKLTLIKQSM